MASCGIGKHPLRSRYSVVPAFYACNACSISAIRSSTCSTPIDRRTRSAGHCVPGPSTLARCSARLSTEPSEVARLNTRNLAVKAFAASSPLLRRSDIIPPTSPRICFAATACPGFVASPGHAVAAKQMRGGFGGMMSLRLKSGEDAAKAFTARLRVFKRATSLGSVESLAEHRASVEGPGTQCPADLVRLSIGVEHVEDLIDDIAQALQA